MAPLVDRRSGSSKHLKLSKRVKDDAPGREQALEESFWDGVFGIVGIRNHSEIDFTDPDIFRLHRESSQEVLKVHC